jgi:TolA-binding protein
MSHLLSEPSAFDAGRLDANTLYGLTENEKQLKQLLDKINNFEDISKEVLNLKNEVLNLKNQINKLENTNKEVLNLKNEVNRMIERQEGLASVLDSINRKITVIGETVQTENENSNLSIGQLKTDLKDLQTNSKDSQAYLKDLQAYIEESREIELINQENVKKVFEEIALVIDRANVDYIELEKRVVALENKGVVTYAPDAPTTRSNIDFKSMSSEELLKSGEKLFETKNYSEAKPYFQELVSRNHRPARSNFILGEIAYFSEDWNEAIVQYKKSAGLYDKADYMPKLLYHTAISFDKIGEKISANQFYKLLKAVYPDSSEAKVSPNR